MSGSVRGLSDRGKTVKRVLLVLLILAVLAGGGYFGYLKYKQIQADKHQKAFEDLKEKAFVTTTPVQTAAKPTEEPAVTPEPTIEPTGPSAEEMLYAAIAEKYEDFLTIRPDFNILHKENKDIFAYIAIPGTIIDYPVLKSEKEDYYLHYNLDHSKGYPGCLYIQNCNSATLNDRFTIIYGHNMLNGTMFGSLKKFSDRDFRETHPFFFIYQEGRVMVYEVVVVSHLEPEHLLSEDYVERNGQWVFDAFDGYETARFLKRVHEENPDKAYVSTPAPTDEDTIMVLSTCGEGRRYTVAGKLVLDIKD